MPRIKRWHPLSHNFNRDPEVRQLRAEYAEWMGYVWIEMLAWGDRNEGELKGKPELIAAGLSDISMTNRPSLATKRIINAFTFMQKCGWIEIQTDRILITKYTDYHKSRESRQTPQGNLIGSLPSEPSEPSLPNLPNQNKKKIEDTNVSSCAEISDFAPAEHPLNGRRARKQKKSSAPSEQALTLATKLKDSLLANYPDARPPTAAQVEAWAEDFDKLNRLDGKTWEQIEWLLAWSQKDPFWSQNIQSGASFRKHWNQLLAKASKEQPQTQLSPDEAEKLSAFIQEGQRLQEEARRKKNGH